MGQQFNISWGRWQRRRLFIAQEPVTTVTTFTPPRPQWMKQAPRNMALSQSIPGIFDLLQFVKLLLYF
jgi:hypothetical protein